jgi:hypothetical protein
VSSRRRQGGADGLSGGGGDQEARDDGMRVVLSRGDMDRLTSRSHLRDGARGEKGGQGLLAEILRDTGRRDTAVTREEAAKADRVQNEALVAAAAARAMPPPGKCFLFNSLPLPPSPLPSSNVNPSSPTLRPTFFAHAPKQVEQKPFGSPSRLPQVQYNSTPQDTQTKSQTKLHKNMGAHPVSSPSSVVDRFTKP